MAAELRKLRESAGVSGRELGQRIGISQSKVSRIESGATMPPVPAVAAWAEAVGASRETRRQLAALTETAFAEVQAWRSPSGARHLVQEQVEQREANARQVRVYQPSLVPGLLQTAEYARRVFTLLYLPCDGDDLARAVAARINRQLALYHPERHFAFLITETALRWRAGPAPLLSAQIDRLASLSTLENVSIGLIPQAAEPQVIAPVGFDAYEDPDGDTVVTVETLHANLFVTDHDHIADYERVWSLLRATAIFDEDARGFLHDIRTSLRDTA